MTDVRTTGTVTGGLVGLLVTAALTGCTSASTDDKARASATRLAHDDIAHTAVLVNSWLRSSADVRAGYELTRSNLTKGGFSIRGSLLQSRYSATALVFDVTTTARGEDDNGFGGGHTEKTVRMCVRLTSATTPGPGR